MDDDTWSEKPPEDAWRTRKAKLATFIEVMTETILAVLTLTMLSLVYVVLSAIFS